MFNIFKKEEQENEDNHPSITAVACLSGIGVLDGAGTIGRNRRCMYQRRRSCVGKRPEDGRTPSDYDNQKESPPRMVPRSSSVMRIVVKNLMGGTFTLVVGASDTIGDVKAEIQERGRFVEPTAPDLCFPKNKYSFYICK